jgi:hypothetical protein
LLHWTDNKYCILSAIDWTPNTKFHQTQLLTSQISTLEGKTGRQNLSITSSCIFASNLLSIQEIPESKTKIGWARKFRGKIIWRKKNYKLLSGRFEDEYYESWGLTGFKLNSVLSRIRFTYFNSNDLNIFQTRLGLLVCDAVYSCKWLPKFRRNLPHPSAE